jgi:hypothetical protein
MIDNMHPTQHEYDRSLTFNKSQHKTAYDWVFRRNQFYWPLQHDEYIVYNTDQVKIRYMIQFGK